MPPRTWGRRQILFYGENVSGEVVNKALEIGDPGEGHQLRLIVNADMPQGVRVFIDGTGTRPQVQTVISRSGITPIMLNGSKAKVRATVRGGSARLLRIRFERTKTELDPNWSIEEAAGYE